MNLNIQIACKFGSYSHKQKNVLNTNSIAPINQCSKEQGGNIILSSMHMFEWSNIDCCINWSEKIFARKHSTPSPMLKGDRETCPIKFSLVDFASLNTMEYI